MTRTVKVGLQVDEAPFVRGMQRAERAAEGLDDALEDVTGSAKDTMVATGRATESVEDLGGSARDAGRDLASLREDAARLDRQIDETTRGIRDLAREIAATSDEAERARLSEKLTGEQGNLRQQTTLRKLIDVESGAAVGAELAEKASLTFAARFGPLLARAPMAGMNPAALAIGAPIAAGVATLLGTAAGGAIIGAVGAGGVIGGLTLAAKDPAVKAAGSALGAELSAMLGRASSAFVPETLDAMDIIRDRMLGMEPDFNRLFSSASRYVDPLVDGLFDAAENAMPGLIRAMDSAGPVIEVVAEGVAELGAAVGEGLSELAPYADEGARALQTLFGVMTFGLEVTFEMVEGMSRLYKAAEVIGAVLTGDTSRFIALITAQDSAKASSVDLTGVLGSLQGRLSDVGTEAMTGEQAVEELKTAFDAIFNENMAYDRAIIAMKDGMKELNKELREGKRTLNENTAAGRENRAAVLDQIEKVNGLRDAMIRQGKPMDEVNGKYREGIAKIREKLEKMGYEKTEIDKLIGKYEDIPAQVSTRISAETAQAEENLAAVRNLIAQIKSKRVVITTDYYGRQTTRSEGRNVGIGDGIGGRRWGGIVEHAQWGRLREAQIAAPVAPARYAWAEPATGGEAFIPRFGDPDRSLDILSKAARWYGREITGPGGGGAGGGASVTNHNLNVYPQQANFTLHDLEGLQRRQDAMSRIGRPR